MYKFQEGGLPILAWLENQEDLESGAAKQAVNLSLLPFAVGHICLMPDTHQGYGMPIGGVLATKDVIIPNAVGVDIGCGMCAVKTNIKVEELTQEKIKKLFGGSKGYHGGIRSAIPTGFNHHSKKQDERLMPPLPQSCEYLRENDFIIYQEWSSARKQIGTLGGGNHFIEIQKDEKDNVWIMLHSGSRNLGFKVANHYNKVAIELNKRWLSSVPKNHELAFLPISSEEGVRYSMEMSYCVDFAFNSRRLMMTKIEEIFADEFPHYNSIVEHNIAHNYAAIENHFGKNLIVHRKGATRAYEDAVGIIPGSQGAASYIVKGLGNPASFKSCSHGAGRRMSRTKAKAQLDLATEIKKMNDQGIVHGLRNVANLDEAPSAYKDIDVVMENQKDLVEVLYKLQPMAVIKG